MHVPLGLVFTKLRPSGLRLYTLGCGMPPFDNMSPSPAMDLRYHAGRTYTYTKGSVMSSRTGYGSHAE
ncbi:hypothetical protein EJ06DRAFT_303250 [Trichodelitschia bisporula]|uniref:Uncharacterized protein n=1 Tax=Trichodelitschia bisporula TaxID=703511 RepID=A0A6G1I6V0_9PEZI|nr:hypothetical protein EJ06DRAFT_303250 [Trichodelitschia bisporula]